MEDLAATIELEGGMKAKIVHDPDCGQPFEEDESIRIVVLHGKYSDPSEGKCGRSPEEVLAWVKENGGEWFTIPLWLYDHSGTSYRTGWTNPFHCPWDSGQVGIVALKRADFDLDDKELEKAAENIASTYSEWANGECYGYVIEDEEGNDLEACFGYVGLDDVIEAAKEAAPSRSPAPGFA